ncbi:hypothetical protein [Thermoflexus sp.]|uniref:hypothetical protein n=1 Tax=Thermoflexus sp. TaxID=1969742 RepID=UPI002ADE3B01|nr:hypothetical protein [Thermoflexus sp.]
MAHVERISKSLDVFTRTKGAILFRGDEVWTALSPGSDGDVLTIVNGVPAWLPQAGSGGGLVVHHFPAHTLDGSFPWRGVGWEGYSFVRMDNTSSHYIRLCIPVRSSLNDFRLDTTLYLPQVAVGGVVFRLTLYNRAVWPMTMVYTGDFVFTLNHRDYPAVPVSFPVSGFSDWRHGDLVVDLRRNPSDSRNTFTREIYIPYVRVLVR